MSMTTVTPLSALTLSCAERVLEGLRLAPAPVLLVASGGQDDTVTFVTDCKLEPWLAELAKGYGTGVLISQSNTGVIGDAKGHALGVSFSKQSAQARLEKPVHIVPAKAAKLRRALNAQLRSVIGGDSDVAIEQTQSASHALVVLLLFPFRPSRPSAFVTNFGSKLRRQFTGLKFQNIRQTEIDGAYGIKGWYAFE